MVILMPNALNNDGGDSFFHGRLPLFSYPSMRYSTAYILAYLANGHMETSTGKKL